MRIWIARHGQTNLNLTKLMQGRTDEPLNDTGIRQAEARRRQIGDIHFDKVYASPLKRAVQTAEILSGLDASQIETDDRLIEADFGKYEKKKYSRVGLSMSLYWVFPEIFPAPPTVETVDSLKKRSVSFLKDLEKEGEEKGYQDVLVACHGGIMRTLTGYLADRRNGLCWRPKPRNCEIRVYASEQGKHSFVKSYTTPKKNRAQKAGSILMICLLSGLLFSTTACGKKETETSPTQQQTGDGIIRVTVKFLSPENLGGKDIVFLDAYQTVAGEVGTNSRYSYIDLPAGTYKVRVSGESEDLIPRLKLRRDTPDQILTVDCGNLTGEIQTAGDAKMSDSDAGRQTADTEETWLSYDSRDQMEKAAGFSLQLPEGISGTKYQYRAAEDMMEILVTDEKEDRHYIFRKGSSRQGKRTDISSSYEAYPWSDSVVAGSYENVLLRGKDENNVKCAVWVSGGYAYSLEVSEKGTGGIQAYEMKDLVREIR